MRMGYALECCGADPPDPLMDPPDATGAAWPGAALSYTPEDAPAAAGPLGRGRESLAVSCCSLAS